jgi:hypothetical protein
MKVIAIIFLFIILTSCSQMLPGLFQAVDHMETDDAVRVTVSRESMQKETDIDIDVKIHNKDQR